jgi:hypothetical protein
LEFAPPLRRNWSGERFVDPPLRDDVHHPSDEAQHGLLDDELRGKHDRFPAEADVSVPGDGSLNFDDCAVRKWPGRQGGGCRLGTAVNFTCCFPGRQSLPIWEICALNSTARISRSPTGSRPRAAAAAA